MRPTTEEALHCMRRVLAETIMPALRDRYAIEQAGLQMAALEDLARHCRDDIPRLMRANDHILGLVDDARRLVDDQRLAAELDTGREFACRPAAHYPDFDDLNQRNIVLRGLLSSIIKAWPRTAGLSAQRRELRDRIRLLLENEISTASA